jgi:transposase
MKMLKNVPLWKLRLREEAKSEYTLILEEIKKNKLKRVDKRLQVIKLHLEGNKQQEIADKLGYSREWVNRLIKEYRKKGLEEYARHNYGGNHRSMSVEEEAEILKQFEEEAEKGTLVIANSIKKAFDEKLGKDTGRGYIYMLLKRHKMRKVMPRSSHPKKAADEVVYASKKLTFGSGN